MSTNSSDKKFRQLLSTPLIVNGSGNPYWVSLLPASSPIITIWISRQKCSSLFKTVALSDKFTLLIQHETFLIKATNICLSVKGLSEVSKVRAVAGDYGIYPSPYRLCFAGLYSYELVSFYRHGLLNPRKQGLFIKLCKSKLIITSAPELPFRAATTNYRLPGP